MSFSKEKKTYDVFTLGCLCDRKEKEKRQNMQWSQAYEWKSLGLTLYEKKFGLYSGGKRQTINEWWAREINDPILISERLL